uniref:G protein n=1 Tax=Corixo rhabdovirus 1 TaxID=3078402 RepID=A0AB38Z1Q1_9RHAB
MKKMLFVFVLVSLTVMPISGLLIPIPGQEDWVPVSPEGLKCPNKGQAPASLPPNRKLVTIMRPAFREEVLVPGLVCQRWELRTSCSRSVLFSDTVRKTIRSLPVSSGLCKTEFQAPQVSETIFPDPDCRWMKNTDVISTSITLHSKSLYFLPSSNSFRQEPTNSYCIAQHGCDVGSSIWFNMTHYQEECFQDTLIEVAIQVVETEHHDVELKSLHYHSHTLKTACLAHYCGVQGLRLDTGEWMSLSTELSTALGDHIPTASCTKELSDYINIKGDEILDQELEQETEQVVLDILCMERLEKIQTTSTISLFDISLLLPHQPGGWFVFLYNSGRWYQTKARYIPGYWDVKLANKLGYLGTASNNKPIYWEQLTKNGSNLLGPNGFAWNSTGYLINHPSFLNLQNSQHALFHRVALNNPVYDAPSPTIQEKILTGSESHHSTSTITFHLTFYIILCISLLLTIAILRKVVKFLNCRHSRGAMNNEALQLDDLIPVLVERYVNQNTHLTGPQLNERIESIKRLTAAS